MDITSRQSIFRLSARRFLKGNVYPKLTHMLIADDAPDRNVQCAREVFVAAKAAGAPYELVVVKTMWPTSSELNSIADMVIDMSEAPWAGPAHDIALEVAEGELYLYTCSKHCRFFDVRWLENMIAPLMRGAVIAGDVRYTGFGKPALGLDEPEIPGVNYLAHVQGGLWAGRVDALLKVKSDPRFPHGYEDVIRSWRLMEAGHNLTHVPQIFSTGVRGEVCPDDSAVMAVHDYR